MEWTDAATQELDAIMARLEQSLNPNEVDPAEVVADLRDRIKAEIAQSEIRIVTAENVSAAARKIGVFEMIQPDKIHEAFKVDLTKPLRRHKRIATAWFWFTGILLPIIALALEAITHLSFSSGLPDPLPTPFHGVLIALVPIANYLAWRTLKNQRSIPSKWLGLLLGIATAVAAFNAILFSFITPFAFIGFIGIIYFGLGLLCFLPLSPLFSFITLLRVRNRLKREKELHFKLFKKGLLTGFAAILLLSTPMYLTHYGLVLANSDNPDTQLRGIHLLRTIGDKAILNRACYNWGTDLSDPIKWLIYYDQHISRKQTRTIYYRVTGEAFNTHPSPTIGFRSRRNPGTEFNWDPELGGDVVAGRLKGLSLSDSRIDGIVHPDAATAYLEWTMVFKNDWYSQREARAQIALPAGAVVSRLTLWVDGEEREAAFGGRSQVKTAYKKVVRRRRDPVLVTTCGPDRILVQCFPVTTNGEMKIRIGITAPLATPAEKDRTLRLPHLIERNFRIPQSVKHAVWIEGGLTADLTDPELNSPTSILHLQSPNLSCWAPDGTSTILQEIRCVTNTTPRPITVVIDTSRTMKKHYPAIATAIGDRPYSILLADDQPLECPTVTALKKAKSGGGKDNAPTLRKAFLQGNHRTIIWIHAAQSWSLSAAENLRQALERQSDIDFYELQIESGPNRLVEKLDRLSGFHAIERTASLEDDLQKLFRSFDPNSTTWKAVRSQIDQPPAALKTDDHLVRLYALDQIKANLAGSKPQTKQALQLALKYHLVTPVSGAVVLETAQQYKEAKLEPVDSNNVPSVPEPNVLILFTFAILLLLFGRRILWRIRLFKAATFG